MTPESILLSRELLSHIEGLVDTKKRNHVIYARYCGIAGFEKERKCDLARWYKVTPVRITQIIEGVQRFMRRRRKIFEECEQLNLK